MEILQLRKLAGETATRYVMHLHDDQWNIPSTYPGWTVRDTVNHLVKENYWEPEFVSGKRAKDVGNKYEGDLLGASPREIWEKTLHDADAAIEANPNVIDRICHLPHGDVPCHEYISQRILDLTIRSWDLAKSTGQDTVLPPELVQFLWDTFANQEKLIRDSGVFIQKVDIPPDADLQTKLLGVFGRK